MYEFDDAIYYKNHIVGSQFSLCGINYNKDISISGYRHKFYKDIKCPKCREIYEYIRNNSFANYNSFMEDFKYRYYYKGADRNVYEDLKNDKIDLNTGLSSYSTEMQNIINKVFIDNKDIEFLKQSDEVKIINVEDTIRYYFKYIAVEFELLHGDKFYKQTESIYMGKE